MRWIPFALPSRDKDREAGLAGDPHEWANLTLDAFDVPIDGLFDDPVDFSRSIRGNSRNWSTRPLPVRREETYEADNSSLFFEHRLRDLQRMHVAQMERRVREPLGPRPLDAALDVPTEQLSQSLQVLTDSRRPASADGRREEQLPTSSIRETTRLEEARSAEVLHRARALRRDLREFINRYGGVGNTTTATSVPSAPEEAAAGVSDENTVGRRRRRSISPFSRDAWDDLALDGTEDINEGNLALLNGLTPAQAYAERVRRSSLRRRVEENDNDRPTSTHARLFYLAGRLDAFQARGNGGEMVGR